MLTFVRADDWLAIYKDDFCIYQNHNIDPEQLLCLMGVSFDSVYAQEQADNLGEFPYFLRDVKPDPEA